METLFTLLLVLLFGALPVLFLKLFKRKGHVKNIAVSNAPFEQTPRYRDGAISYNQDRWGVRWNVEVENPYALHNSRYQRRHATKRHQQTKPWMR